jgi:hypothetical protein
MGFLPKREDGRALRNTRRSGFHGADPIQWKEPAPPFMLKQKKIPSMALLLAVEQKDDRFKTPHDVIGDRMSNKQSLLCPSGGSLDLI